MQVNGLTLPNALSERILKGELHRRVGSWPLRSSQDSFGNPLGTELGEFLSTNHQAEATRQLPTDFPSNNGNEFATGPSAIPDPVDFSKIIVFAIAGDGSPFCLDYREGDPPSVIWWDDTHWIRVSPDYESFLMLFDFSYQGAP